MVADGLAELQVRWPGVPIVFSETRQLTEEWTSAQAAVAQARLHLGVAQPIQVQPEGSHRPFGGFGQIGRQQRVVQLAAEQVLRRQVCDDLGLRTHLRADGVQPPRHQLLPDCTGQRHVQIVRCRPRQRHPLTELQLLQKLLGEAVHVGEVDLQKRVDGGHGPDTNVTQFS